MLHTLAGALLLTPTAAPADDLLLGLLPEDTAVAVRVGNLAALVEKPAKDRGAWERLFADERMRDVLDLEDDELDVDALATFAGLAGQIEGAVFSMDSVEPDSVSGVLRLRDGYREVWTETLAPLGIEFDDGEVDGLACWIATDETGDSVYLLDSGDLTLFAAGEEAAAKGSIAAALAALEDGPSVGQWWERIDARVDDPLVEAFAEFAALELDDPEAMLAEEWIEGIYMGFSVGDGNQSEFVFGASLFDQPRAPPLRGRLWTRGHLSLGGDPR